MNPKPLLRAHFRLVLAMTATLAAYANNPPVASNHEDKKSAPIPMDQLGAVAGKQYQGDGLSVSATPDGARLRCAFQRLEGQVTREGLWLNSTADASAGERFRVWAMEVGRVTPCASLEDFGFDFLNPLTRPSATLSLSDGERDGLRGLPRSGIVNVTDNVARFIRPGLTEEYSVSVDGVRQDFIIEQRPEGDGELRVELKVTGAKAEPLVNGARLVLDGSGRKLTYNCLRVVDATGRELPARMEVIPAGDEDHNSRGERLLTGNNSVAGLGSQTSLKPCRDPSDPVEKMRLLVSSPTSRRSKLAVLVDDANAVYPVRIDPTFSDADWVSMGGVPGANNYVYAALADGAGNLYIGGSFTTVGGVLANRIAKWDGNAWSALGAGMNSSVVALAVSSMMPTPATLDTQWEHAGTILTNGDAVDPATTRLHPASLARLNDGIGLYYSTWTNKNLTGPANEGRVKMAVATNLSLFNSGKLNVIVTPATLTSASGPNPYTYVSGAVVKEIDGKWWMTVFAGTNSSGTFEGETSAGLLLYSTNGVNNWTEAPSSPYAPFPPNTGVSWDVRNVFCGTITKVDELWYIHYIAYQSSPWPAGGDNGWGFLHYATSTNPMIAGSWVRAVGQPCVFDAAGNPLGNLGGNGSIVWLPDQNKWLAQLGFVMAACTNRHPTNFIATTMWLNTGLTEGAGWDQYWGFSFFEDNGLVGVWDSHPGPVAEAGGDFIRLLRPVSAARPELYAGGAFTTAGGTSANHIAKWNGTAWSSLGSGMDSSVHSLAVSGGELYAGGWFTTAGTNSANHVAKWNGSTWSTLGSGLNSTARALAVSGTNLYAGGQFTAAGGNAANCIAKWNGNSWTALGSGVNGDVLVLAASGNDVYAGGGFTIAGGSPVNRVAKWDGSSWTALGLGMGNTVSALAVSGSDLYAGGDFTTAGGIAANRIAKWDGCEWTVLGSGMNNSVNALTMSGTNLYAGGQFTIAGNQVSPYVAKANIGAARGRFSNLLSTASIGFSCTFLDASVGQPYRIQTSPSLVAGSWTDFTNFTYTAPIVITDASALSGTNKFFRAITP